MVSASFIPISQQDSQQATHGLLQLIVFGDIAGLMLKSCMVSLFWELFLGTHPTRKAQDLSLTSKLSLKMEATCEKYQEWSMEKKFDNEGSSETSGLHHLIHCPGAQCVCAWGREHEAAFVQQQMDANCMKECVAGSWHNPYGSASDLRWHTTRTKDHSFTWCFKLDWL